MRRAQSNLKGKAASDRLTRSLRHPRFRGNDDEESEIPAERNARWKNVPRNAAAPSEMPATLFVA
jgi:hypothetical protein